MSSHDAISKIPKELCTKQFLLKNSLSEHDKIFHSVCFGGLFENWSRCYCGDLLFGFSPSRGPVLWRRGCLLRRAHKIFVSSAWGMSQGAVCSSGLGADLGSSVSLTEELEGEKIGDLPSARHQQFS